MFSQQWDDLPMFTTLNLIATKVNKASKSSASTSPKFRLRMALVRIAEAICMQNMRWENAERYQRISKRDVILGSDPLMEPYTFRESFWPSHLSSYQALSTLCEEYRKHSKTGATCQATIPAPARKNSVEYPDHISQASRMMSYTCGRDCAWTRKFHKGMSWSVLACMHCASVSQISQAFRWFAWLPRLVFLE